MRRDLLYSFILFVTFSFLCFISYSPNVIGKSIYTGLSNIYFDKDVKTSYINPHIIIPSINLDQDVVVGDRWMESINKNISFYYNTGTPDSNKLIVLMAHSGNGKHSYFTNIDKLNKNDVIYLFYKNVKYKYIVSKSYLISGNDMSVLNEEKQKGLLLITCYEDNNKKRLVVQSFRSE